jgi:hypothetical protein
MVSTSVLGSPTRTPVLPVLAGGEITSSLMQSGPPHRSDHPRHQDWLNRATIIGSLKLMSSLAPPPPIHAMLHEIRSSLPGAPLDRDDVEVEVSHHSVVGRWGHDDVDWGNPRVRRRWWLRFTIGAGSWWGSLGWTGRVVALSQSWWHDSSRGLGKP